MLKKWGLAAAVGTGIFHIVAVPAVAQEQATDEARQKLDEIRALYRELNGMVATEYGAIGTYISDRLRFKNDTGMYDVVFDAGRDARREIADCRINSFDWRSSDCLYDVDFEYLIEIPEKDIARGIEISIAVIDLSER